MSDRDFFELFGALAVFWALFITVLIIFVPSHEETSREKGSESAIAFNLTTEAQCYTEARNVDSDDYDLRAWVEGCREEVNKR